MGNINDWTRFEDGLYPDKYQEGGVALLGRKYVKGTQYICKYISEHSIDSGELPPIVAQGITAYLANMSSLINYTSFRMMLGNGTPIRNLEKIFLPYFDHCLKFIRDEEYKNPFEDERRSEIELIQQHVDAEELALKKSDIFFTEVYNGEQEIIANIRKAALMYPQWVKKTYLKESNNNARPFPNEYSISQLKLIYSRSKEKKFIDCTEQCFLYWFGGIGEKQAKIKWIKERGKDPYKAALVSYAKKFNSETIPSMINDVFDIKVDSNNKECTRIKSLNEIFKDL